MEYSIVHPGTNAVLTAKLWHGEKIKVAVGTLISRSSHLTVSEAAQSGFWQAIKRSSLPDDAFYFQELECQGDVAEALIAPAVPGDIQILKIDQEHSYLIKAGSVLAAFALVEIETRAQQLSAGVLSGKGLFILECRGNGAIAIAGFGTLMEIVIAEGDQQVIDNNHVVAWSAGINYKILKTGSNWLSTFTAGDGLSCEFKGPGSVWIQTRNPGAFGKWVGRYSSKSSFFSLS